jgi:hypothetical protein
MSVAYSDQTLAQAPAGVSLTLDRERWQRQRCASVLALRQSVQRPYIPSRMSRQVSGVDLRGFCYLSLLKQERAESVALQPQARLQEHSVNALMLLPHFDSTVD